VMQNEQHKTVLGLGLFDLKQPQRVACDREFLTLLAKNDVERFLAISIM
jgi:hypothetical protein